MPAYITVSVCPKDERPAVRAKGTVRPSAKPRVKSARKRERDGHDSHVEEEGEEAWCWAGFRGSDGDRRSVSVSEKLRSQLECEDAVGGTKLSSKWSAAIGEYRGSSEEVRTLGLDAPACRRLRVRDSNMVGRLEVVVGVAVEIGW